MYSRLAPLSQMIKNVKLHVFIKISLSLPRYQFITNMKNRNFFLLVAAVTLASCNSHSSYTIDGTVSDSTLNGNTIYLADMASRNTLDSAVITNNKFKFTGKADTAFVGMLQVPSFYRMGFIVENGHIAVELGETDKVSGTPLNDEFASFMNDIDSLNQIFIAKQQEIIAKGLSDEEASAEWNATGHVPFREKDKLYKEYHDILDKLYKELNISTARRRLDKFRNNLKNVAEKGVDALDNERARMMRRYESLKQEIQTYENNIGFLNASSKKGNSLIDEMNRKVQKLKDELNLVHEKIKAIDAENNG